MPDGVYTPHPSPAAQKKHDQNTAWWKLHTQYRRNILVIALSVMAAALGCNVVLSMTTYHLVRRPPERIGFVLIHDDGSPPQIFDHQDQIPPTERGTAIEAFMWEYLGAWEKFVWIESEQRDRWQMVSHTSSPSVALKYQEWYAGKDGPPARGAPWEVTTKANGMTAMAPTVIKADFTRLYYKADDAEHHGVPLMRQPCEVVIEFVFDDSMPKSTRVKYHNPLGIVPIRYQLQEFPIQDFQQEKHQ